MDGSGVNIVEMDVTRKEHLIGLVELLNVYYNDDMGENKVFDADTRLRLVSGILSHPTAMVFFAECNDKVVGLATCFTGFSTFSARKLINIHDLIVLQEYRRQGIARRILQAVEKKAKEMDCCKLTLEVRKDNFQAMRLYRRSGFGSGSYPMLFWTKALNKNEY
jgi:ribosomal protein S18 acetylase RimI-like enzyme